MPYYYLKKKAPVNYFSIGELANFRNTIGGSDTAISANRLYAIDRVPTQVMFGEPYPIVEESRAHGRNIAFSDIVGYAKGALDVPDHPVKSGRWWYYVGGSCTTVSATYETHTITEADTVPPLGVHAEMEHATGSDLNLRRDLVGCAIESATLTFGQDAPTSQSFTVTVSKALTGNDVAINSAMDYKQNFLPGKFSALVEYGGTTQNFLVLDGTITATNKFEYIKSADDHPSEIIPLNRDYTINMNGIMSTNELQSIPETTTSYSSNTLTLDIKFMRSDNDYIRFSFNNLERKKLNLVKIDEAQYVWKTNVVLKNCGARTAVSRGVMAITVVDDLSSTRYEG